ncbi:MAG: efflux RND transporter periplasmic adaptor subunit [Alphaproteobacteria bacterium]|nr:efflux RND transporter periplasmic adaptor subunit [Alphaproteobacteria bacterium]
MTTKHLLESYHWHGLRSSYKAAILIVAVSVLWILSGVFAGNGDDSIANGKGAVLQEIRVRTLNAVDTASEYIVHGKTEAFRKVNIKAETSGRVVKTGVNKGENISKGDVIVKLADNDRRERKADALSLLAHRNLEYNVSKKLSKKGFNSKVKLAQATANRDAAITKLKSAKLDIKNAKITAPFDGLLETRNVEIGDFVSVGNTVASIIALNPIKIIVEIPESYISKIKKGSIGYARLITGQLIEGVVTYISAVSNPKTRTYIIELEAPNPDFEIQDGLTLELRLTLETVKAHKISPAVLTLNKHGEIGVKTVDESDIVKFHSVKIIKQNLEGMWVSGLPENIRLITIGQECVKEGEKATAIDEAVVNLAIKENTPVGDF